jgi:hypothetical protein
MANSGSGTEQRCELAGWAEPLEYGDTGPIQHDDGHWPITGGKCDFGFKTDPILRVSGR